MSTSQEFPIWGSRGVKATAREAKGLANGKAMAPRHQPQEADVEKRLQSLWASVLNISPDAIRSTDNCFHLGADSFSALRLAAAAEYQGLSLSVPDIFQHPHIRDQAALIVCNDDKEAPRKYLGPFSLIPKNVPRTWLRERAASLCCQKAEQVCDVFPCLPSQGDGLAIAAEQPDSCIARLMFDLPASIQNERFLRAWNTTVASIPSLRTRIVHLDSLGLMHVVLDTPIDCIQYDNLTEYNTREASHSLGKGTPLCKVGLIEEPGRRRFVLILHRVLFDHWSTFLILRMLEDAYSGAATLELLPHRSLVQQLLDAPSGPSTRFWKRELTHVQATGFPALPLPAYQPRRHSMIEHGIKNLPRNIGGTTPATAVRAAWALLQARYTGADEIVFGAQVSGRHVVIPGIKSAVASTAAIVPLRINIDFDTSVEVLLLQVQNQTIEMMPFEPLNQKLVSYMRDNLKKTDDFQTLLTVMTIAESRPMLFDSNQLDDDQTGTGLDVLNAYNSFALWLDCITDIDGIKLRLSFDSTVIDNTQARRVAHQLEHVLRQLCDPAQAGTIVNDLDLVSRHDALDMWNWNVEVPEDTNECVHSLVAKVVRSQPDAPAICAWDGDLTYSELDDLSTRWAHFLLDHGVGIDAIVPICFKKSMWTPVAIFGIMKAGGSWVALDHTQPQDRLRSILSQVDAKLIVSSSSNKELAASLISGGQVVVVDQIRTRDLAEIAPDMNLPTISVNSKLYTTFTSGSTGVPKGVIITHLNFSSAITHQVSAMKIGRESRVFDSPRYVFDTAWATILFTLAAGACVCTPCERDMHNPEKVMRDMRVDFAGMTPTVARMLEPSRLPDLKVLILGGEALRSPDVQRWQGRVAILNTYGPSECTPTATVQQVLQIDAKDPPIGWLFGLCGWVVNAKNSQRLMGIGEVGELWLEGPLVGAGYLNNPEKTAAAFVNDPTWLVRGGPSGQHAGRKGLLYRTGDLVRRQLDGSLDFIRRKDGQVKIRGQRVELAEVEHHLMKLLEQQVEGEGTQAIAEVVMPLGGPREMLVAFVVPKGGITMTKDALASLVSRLTDGLESQLRATLPSYMIPNIYIPLARVPTTLTAKVDHRRLREIAATSTLNQLATSKSHRKRPVSTAMEVKLVQLWAAALSIAESDIGADDSFFRSGGDSITAMQLAGIARDHGFNLTVEDVFTHPRLSDLAEIMVEESQQVDEPTIEPFGLLRFGKSVARQKSATLCGLDPVQIEDVFPCTPLQSGLLALTALRADNYVVQFVHQVHEDADIQRFRAAWDAVVLAAPTLRTRIVDLEHQGLFQVVVHEEVKWTIGAELAAYCVAAKQRPFGLGTSLAEFGLIEEVERKRKFFVWTMHHSIFDGWSIPLLHELAEKAYRNEPLSSPPPFQRFIRHVLSVDENRAAEAWRAQFEGLEAEPFPPLPSANHKSKVDETVDNHIRGLHWPETDVTASTAVQTAWAIWMARYTGSDDVLFGRTGNGRQVPVSEIGHMTGPTFATVPVRLTLDADETIEQLSLRTQKQRLEMVPFEQMGLARIQRISEDAKRACGFQTLLVVQPSIDTVWRHHSNLFSKSDQMQHEARGDVLQARDTYPMILSCSLQKNGLLVHISFDSSVIGAAEIRRISRQFEYILRQVCAPENSAKPLAEVRMLSDSDLQDIWKWNKEVPQTDEVCIHDLFAKIARRQPDAPAVCAWDGELTYQHLDELSTQLASHLVEAGVGPDVIVPLCFEKSMWTPIAMLGVMKAGGASLAMDTTLPEERLRTMVKLAAGQVILSSTTNDALAHSLAGGQATVLIPEALSQQGQCAVKSLPIVSPSNMFYVVFTSGSTGTPKGAIITHANAGSAVRHQQAALRIVPASRVYDFASYAFDVSWSNHLQTLTAGGCVCIPSQDDRLNDITGSIQRLRANYVAITPSVARLIDPASVPVLRTIRFGGEVVKKEDVLRWEGTGRTLLQSYGPAECTISTTVLYGGIDHQRVSTIGEGIGLNTWILDVKTGSMLSSVGAVGELWLEGPLVGRGYLDDAKKTAAAFFEDPAWLRQGAPGYPGRQGWLYRTGDLVQYNEDGGIMFVGRKDGQVKIHGQRVELAEVEHHILHQLDQSGTDESQHRSEVAQVAANVISTQDGKKTTLVAFIIPQGAMALTEDALVESVARLTNGVNSRLAATIPSYMVPSAYIPLARVPMTPTGKVDHRRLLELSTITLNQMAETPAARSESRRAPSTVLERKLQQLWASVLRIDEAQISAEDSFFRIGGDSIDAMRLVAEARISGLSMTVADIFQTPRLCDLAESVSQDISSEPEATPAFSLLRRRIDQESIRNKAAVLCFTTADQVEDVLPCTPLQEGLLALAIRRPGDYVARFSEVLRGDVDIVRFCKAWESTVALMPILRTRIVDLPQEGVVQVVLREIGQWKHCSVLEEDTPQGLANLDLGSPLSEYAIIRSPDGPKTTFVWTVHHAIYDGWSRSKILEVLHELYKGALRSSVVEFGPFIKSILSTGAETAKSYWQNLFRNCEAEQFPRLPSLNYNPRSNGLINLDCPLPDRVKTDFTMSTSIRAALATVISAYTSSSDIVYGAVVTGRQAAVRGIEDIAGPTIATVPVRVVVDKSSTVAAFQRQVQSQATAMIPFEQTGLQHIRPMNDDTARACQFQVLLVIHPSRESKRANELFEEHSHLHTENAQLVQEAFDSHGLTLHCFLSSGGVAARFSFDSALIDEVQVKRLAAHFSHVLQKICSSNGDARLVSELQATNKDDLRDIWSWNAIAPPSKNVSVRDLIMTAVTEGPGSLAIDAWDGRLTYQQFHDLASRLAGQLVQCGVGPNVVVPLCFEKSMWAPVAMLAVMIAGGASVLLDSTQPKERLLNILDQVKPKAVVSSQANAALANDICDCTVLSIYQATVEAMTSSAPPEGWPVVTASDLCGVVFTSGSSGTPKGALLTHGNYASSVSSHVPLFGITRKSRLYDFVTYSFDIAWSNFTLAFCSGACLCIPSEYDRKNNLLSSLCDSQATFAFITTSIARELQVYRSPSLETLAVGGEPLNSSDEAMVGHGCRVLSVYGPAECTILATIYELRQGQKVQNQIGHNVHTNTWVIQDGNPCPIGATGELWLEGPLVGRGYLQNAEKTAAAFIEDPPWLLAGGPGQSGRRGRLYKSGDLARYNSDGTLEFVGRTDNQVKLRGQRVELAEVEHHVRQALVSESTIETAGFKLNKEVAETIEVVAQAITPRGGDRPVLVALISLGRAASLSEDEHNAAVRQMVRGLEDQLQQQIPAYIVPVAYVPVHEMPRSATDKTDRRRLREKLALSSLQDLIASQSSSAEKRKPSTPVEKSLQQIWSSVLNMDVKLIGLDDSFIHLGGDSISAMRLVRKAREKGIAIRLNELLKAPRLWEQAKSVQDKIDARK